MTVPTHPRPVPSTVAEVLALLTADPGRPRLTWYGPDGERIELSGHVLDNWVAKTANLLVEEFDVAPGSRVLLDLPPHWRAVVWAMATWRLGGTVVLPASPGASEDADVVVTDAPDAHAGTGADVVAVALPALARRFDGDLPAGVTDAAAAVMTYGDVLGWAPPTDPGAEAVVATEITVAHHELLTWAAGPGSGHGERTLLADDDGTTLATVTRALGVLVRDGSVVLCAPAVATELRSEPERLERLVRTEGVTPRTNRSSAT